MALKIVGTDWDGSIMGKILKTGHELLNDKYRGNKDHFFLSIVRGEIEPCTYHGEKYGLGRIFPDHIKAIQGKVAILEELQYKLGLDDETLFRADFCYQKGIVDVIEDEDAFKSYARSEEGQARRAKLTNNRQRWKEDAKKLLAEIGDPEQALAPDVVWQDVTFTPELEEELLNAHYLVGLIENYA